MSRRTIQADAELCPELLDRWRAARRIAVLTGAGVSAESGIPTFRAAQTGLWAQHDPMQLASPEGFAADPTLVWDWYAWRRRLIAEAQPNPGHHALARLGEAHPAFTLITQNVDGLHQRAGSRAVLELHGNITRTICSKTRRPISEDWLARHADSRPPPSPYVADGLARPDVVWFGEALDAAVLDQATRAVQACDLMLIVGTAGAVHPAAGLAAVAHSAGALLIEINPETSALTRLADWHLAGPSAHCLPRLVGALGQ